MASLQFPDSPVFRRFFQPACDAFAGSKARFLCHRISDEAYLSAGVLRCVSDSRSGRDFLQRHGDGCGADISVDLFFKAIQSRRRFNNLASINAGVRSDENVGPGGGAGAMLRRITYVDPADGTVYVYLTTEMGPPPGLLVLIYKQRWDVEKVFDEMKNKLVEKKAWGSSATAKSTQAQFLCLAHTSWCCWRRTFSRSNRSTMQRSGGEKPDGGKTRKRTGRISWPPRSSASRSGF